MWLNEPLSDVLSSRSKVAVIRVLSASPTPLNWREIARRAGITPGHAQRVLADLVSAGLLLSRDQGRANTYEFANPESQITRHLRDLFTAEDRRRREVVEGLFKQAKGVLAVVLFGSEARRETKPGSDTDLLIVVERKTDQLESEVGDVCIRLAAEHQLALSWLVADVGELRDWAEEGNDLWRSIQSEGIRLAGKPLGMLVG